ncbi:T9SS type A sorting domain-containing protein [Flavobacterium sp.]|uniref:T9SS type A sorting domain-containing protein n=1 Tax=Flavobacterium sp. TaxID=239 RepID=UPI0039E4A459
MKPFFYVLLLLWGIEVYPQRQWAVNDSTDYALGNTHIVAGRHKLYLESQNNLSLLYDFTQPDEPDYYIRDFDFIDNQHWYVLVGSRYIGHPTQLYETVNAGADWQPILPESFTVPETLNGKAESINQIQVLDGRIYLFNGYYISNLLYSDDFGQTWVYWFQSVIAHYYQMYRCGDALYLHGLAGDAFQPYLFEIPQSLLPQQNVTNFYSGCHNLSPHCYYPPSNSTVPEIVAYFDTVIDGVCSLGISDGAKPIAGLVANPVQDFFEMVSEVPILKMEVYNLFGQSVAHFDNTAHGNIGNLASGIYLLRVATENGSATLRLLKR